MPNLFANADFFLNIITVTLNYYKNVSIEFMQSAGQIIIIIINKQHLEALSQGGQEAALKMRLLVCTAHYVLLQMCSALVGPHIFKPHQEQLR